MTLPARVVYGVYSMRIDKHTRLLSRRDDEFLLWGVSVSKFKSIEREEPRRLNQPLRPRRYHAAAHSPV